VNENYNVDPKAIEEFDNETKLRIYEHIVTSRRFEEQLVIAFDNKRIPAPIYLCLGQEAVAAAYTELDRGLAFFPQHRAIDLYVSAGGDLAKLRDELLQLPSGISGGRGAGNCIHYTENGIRIFGQGILIGQNAPIACGHALSTGERTVCVMGDGAAEEDYALESYGFAVTYNLPVVFIITDNNLAITASVPSRRSWAVVDVVSAFGMEAYDLADDPWTILSILRKWDGAKPILLNCRTTRERWHSGTGVEDATPWSRHSIVRKQLLAMGLKTEVERIEDETAERIAALWQI
jgi:TPP-dependent pyruvate/acetoin dehydrogenase alpha subunit